MTRKFLIYFLFLSIFASHSPILHSEETSKTNQEKIPSDKKILKINDSELTVEIADNPGSREFGLMLRKELEENSGMLFIFEESQKLCFWMKNTLIPLSIAYMDEDYKIIDLLDMKPLDLTPICSSKPAKYALEVNKGWFEKQGIKTQDKAVLEN